jgi:hypothetical protein
MAEYNQEADLLSDWESEGAELENQPDTDEEAQAAPASAVVQAQAMDAPALAGVQPAVLAGGQEVPAPLADAGAQAVPDAGAQAVPPPLADAGAQAVPDAGAQAVPPPLADAGAQALLVPLADAVSDQEFAEQLLAEEEEERRFWAGVQPLLKDPKSPAQLKHMAFHDEVVARMKAGPVQGVPVTRVELVAQEAQAVLRRLNSAGFLEEAVHDCNKEDATAEKFLKLDRRREMLALNVEYYMVQAGVIRPSVIVKKVCDSHVASMIA